MSDDRDIAEALETLELSSDASIREIRAAYKRLKELYSRGSLATMPVEEEMSKDKQEELLARIDVAYERLVTHIEGEGGLGSDALRLDAEGLKKAGIESLHGKGLKQVREMMGVGLGEIEMKTRIASRYLTAIEEHDFEKLPEEVFVQGYVSGYAKAMGLDHKRAVKDFLSALHEWRSDKKLDDLQG